ncbi:MAG TPA: PAS domain S-box protein [Vicinamibacterales bacterium]|jgi:PAS domain S-box-containing protein|nr:PAS domain S-box protein [Vicinamibacterales bacterium]
MPNRDDFEARLAAIVASSDDAIISKDLSGTIITWNRAAEQMFGYTAADAIGQSISIIIPDERRTEEDYVLAQVKTGLGVDHYETIRRRKDGTLVNVSLTVSPILDRAGTVVGASKVVRDITATKRMEREAFRLAAIVESSDDAVVSKDLDGVIQTWNRGAERLFGYTADEAIGRSIRIVIPADRMSEEDEVLSRIRSGRSVEHFETIRRRKDGTLVDISLTVSPIRSYGGEVVGASKIARDITEQKRLRAIADEASRLKDEFLAVLSHELRTPLNTVLGYTRMLKREDKRMVGELRDRALDALERNAESLSRLVNDVLDTSRIVTGKLRLALESCSVNSIVADAVDTVRPAADAKGIAVHADVEGTPTVMADRDRLQQVIWNLMSNAIKFTSAGGIVTIGARKQNGTVYITVKDTGIGIAQEHLPFVFQRFWQAHTGASREFAGLGIGLALARHLVELHGGSIRVESQGVGRGSEFTVALPSASTLLARERHLRPVAK